MNEPQYETFENLFPMPMSSIEKFHWFDHSAEYPNLIYCRLRIKRRLDQAVARHAWQVAIQRQPFADVAPEQVDGKWHWVQGPRKQGLSDIDAWQGTRFEWQEFAAEPEPWTYSRHPTGSPTGSYLGIFSWPASKDSSVHQTEVWFYVHHAIADGAGAAQVVCDWMTVYANLLSGRAAEEGLHRLDIGLLKERNRLGLLSWSYLRHLWKQPIALFGAIKFVFRKTQPLIPGESEVPVKQEHYPGVVGSWLDADELSAVEAVARKHGVMTNSVLLAQLYACLASFRKRRNVHDEADWMRIILPISVRQVSDRRLPAANRATIVQVDRRSKDAADLKSFYQGLDYEIKVIRGWHLDKIFLIAIRCLSIFESRLKKSARSNKSRGMALFTNLGDPLRRIERMATRDLDNEHHLRPDSFDPFGPIKFGTPVNFSVSRYGARMRVSLHYDTSLFSSQDAVALLESYCDQLKQLGN